MIQKVLKIWPDSSGVEPRCQFLAHPRPRPAPCITQTKWHSFQKYQSFSLDIPQEAYEDAHVGHHVSLGIPCVQLMCWLRCWDTELLIKNSARIPRHRYGEASPHGGGVLSLREEYYPLKIITLNTKMFHMDMRVETWLHIKYISISCMIFRKLGCLAMNAQFG